MQRTTYAPGTPSWIDLGSPDIEASASFYSGLFGWQIDEGPAEAMGYRMCMLRGEAVAGLGSAQQPGPPYWSVYVSVDDADAARQRVLDGGGQVLAEPMDVMGVGRMAVFADPEGAQVSVWQPGSMAGAGLVDEPGALTWVELLSRDPDAASAFYAGAFGWAGTTSEFIPAPYRVFRVGEQMVAGLMPMDDSWPAATPSRWMVCFMVEDADEAVATAQRLGGSVGVAPTDSPPGRYAVLTDPHGATFSVLAP